MRILRLAAVTLIACCCTGLIAQSQTALPKQDSHFVLHAQAIVLDGDDGHEVMLTCGKSGQLVVQSGSIDLWSKEHKFVRLSVGEGGRVMVDETRHPVADR